MAPDSNQQSNTSGTRRNVLPFFWNVRWSMRCGCRSVTFCPVSCSSSATEPMQWCSRPSSDSHMGMGVPQKRLRLMLQSRASASQLAKRAWPTNSGTQWMPWLCFAMRSRSTSTFTYQEGVVL